MTMVMEIVVIQNGTMNYFNFNISIMGQRLVITFQKEGKDIASLYFHWGAYTSSAAYELKRLGYGIMLASKSENAVESLKETFNVLQYKNDNRNEGLPVFTEELIKDHQRCSNGDIYIDLTQQRIFFDVFYNYGDIKKVHPDDLEEIKEYYKPDIRKVDFSSEFDYESYEDIVSYCDQITSLPFYFIDNNNLLKNCIE